MGRRRRTPFNGSGRNNEYTLDNSDGAVWRQAEEWICEQMGWDDVDASTHDAVDADGNTVEIKSCVWRYRDGSPGRAKIWEDQFWTADKLAVIVYEESIGRSSIVGCKLMDMSNVPDLPRQIQRHNTMGRSRYAAPEWTNLMTIWDVRLPYRDGLSHLLIGDPNHIPDGVDNGHEPFCFWT